MMNQAMLCIIGHIYDQLMLTREILEVTYQFHKSGLTTASAYIHTIAVEFSAASGVYKRFLEVLHTMSVCDKVTTEQSVMYNLEIYPQKWKADNMIYDTLDITLDRYVTLCGMNVYPNPEYHPDRTMWEHDLLYIFEGEWTIAQDEQSYLLKAGDAILLRAGSHHRCPVPCAPNTRTMFVHFNKLPGDRKDVELTPAALALRAEESTTCVQTVTSCAQHPEVSKIMRQIIDAFWSQRDDKRRQTSLLVNLLLVDLAFIARSSQQTADEWIVRILRLFRTEPSKMFSLEELADFVNVSVRSLTSRFKATTGQTVHQYQINFKLELAYAALRSTNRTIQDIAVGYGFYDAYQFSRLFKKKYGRSPKHFKLRNPAMNINRHQA